MKGTKLSIEMTLVEKIAINPWQYPPHFDFQYGEWLRTSFEKGVIEPWQNYEMPDLALIVTQVLLKSQTLWGSEPEQLLAHVPYHDFMKAMVHDLDRLASELKDDTRNVLLTYAKIPLIKFDDPKQSITLAEEPFSGDSSLHSGLRGELLEKSKQNF